MVVTRPEPEAAQWVTRLHVAGWPALALPLMDIGPPPDPAALASCHARLASYQAAMFVSPQAVRHFMPGLAAAGGVAGMPRCWAPGPGTARALIDSGVPPAGIDAPAAEASQFDSEALWAVVGPQVGPGFRLLIVRGASEGVSPAPGEASPGATGQGRDWLARQIEDCGGAVDWCVAYRRRPASWSPEKRSAAEASIGAIWLFSSSEGLGHLPALLPQARWDTARALVTHPRIAQAAQAIGFGEVAVTRPALPDVLRGLESML